MGNLLRIGLVLTLIGIAVPAMSAEASKGPITVAGAWARASVVKTGAVYMTLRNRGTVDDRLTGASSPVAARAGLHRTMMKGGVMHMQAVESVDVPAGASVVLAPGGLHVMLMGLDRPLEKGSRLPLILTFERAGRITVDAEIRAAGATAPADNSIDQGHGNQQGQ